MSDYYWADDSVQGLHCRCRCHGTVVFDDGGTLVSYLNVPPRYDSSLGWAESCETCQPLHWVAATFVDQRRSMEADITEEANAYLAHFISKQRKV